MRRTASVLVLAALVLPLSDNLRLTRTRLELWNKLRARHREAPDVVWDRYYAQLAPYLPATGRIGIVQALPDGTNAREREYYFLQYALTPRLLVPGAPGDLEFVITCGPAAGAGLVDPDRFALVKQFERDFSLYRRVRR